MNKVLSCFALAGIMVCKAPPAAAQTPSGATPPDKDTATPTPSNEPSVGPSPSPASQTSTLPAPSDQSQRNETVGQGGAAPQNVPTKSRYAYFDQYLMRGETTTFPGSEDSLLRDAGGFRTWLADRKIGVQLIMSASGIEDFLPTGQPRDPQRFNGQRVTLQTFNQQARFTWKMEQLGLPNTQLTVGFNNYVSSFAPNGPNTFYLRDFSLYQTFLNNKLTIRAGLEPNIYEYVGFYVGGSPILASGVAGLLPIQAGLAATPSTVPMINVTAYGGKGSYIRFGVQRSVSPLGLIEEINRRSNPFDVDFKRRGAGPLYIAEIGVRRPATALGKQIWLRMGGFYNKSDFVRFDGKGTAANASFYALADRQLTQPNKSAPTTGLYAGASFYWIPQNVNTSNYSIEGRVYATGAIKSRPRDTVSLRVTWTKFSNDAQAANEAKGVFVNKSQLNVTGSYSFRAYRGLYIGPALSYLDHPSFIGDYKHALLGAVQIVFLG